MLKMMRDSFQHLKWILIAIVAIFVLFIFVDWGAGGSSGQGDKKTAFAARVNGETISYREYDRALYYSQKNYEQMYRQPLTPEMIAGMGLSKQVMDGLIDQHLMLQEARRLHLSATPDEVRRKILQIQVLNPDGKFVGQELYTRYVTGAMGFQSASEFEDELAREITLQKMESTLANALVISPKSAEAEYRRISESSKIRYVLLPANREAATMTATPAEVDAYYRAHQSDYSHGEQRDVKYLVADLARLRAQIVPGEAELRKRYEASREDFKRQDSAHILHILIRVDPSAAPAVDAAAKAKADSLVQQLRAGADFAKLAKANSGDPSSSGKGGDMGFVDRGVTVPLFDTAAFSIPLNTISDPIRTKEFGYHIIKVLERKPAGYRTFEEVRDTLASQMAEQTAKDQSRDQITAIAAKIKQSKPKTPAEFAAFANDKVSSNDTLWFAKGDAVPGIGSNPAVTSWAFAAKQGDVGDIIGTQRGPAIPYLFGVRPAGVSALEDIRPRVENDARLAKAREAVVARLSKALPAPSIDVLAAKIGATAAETTVSHQGGISGLSGDTSKLVDAAMAAKVGELKGPVAVGDGAVAFQVLEQKKVDSKTVDEGRTAYAEALRQQQARSLRTTLLQRLRKDSSIDVNSKLLEQQSQTQPQAGM